MKIMKCTSLDADSNSSVLRPRPATTATDQAESNDIVSVRFVTGENSKSTPVLLQLGKVNATPGARDVPPTTGSPS
jgi:hypothetical protein